MVDRLLTALGALAAAAAVLAACALLFHALDPGDGDGPKPTTVLGVAVPGGRGAAGREARPGHASVGISLSRKGEGGADGGGSAGAGGPSGSDGGSAGAASGGDASPDGGAASVARADGDASAGASPDGRTDAGSPAAPRVPAPTLPGRPRRGPAFEIASVRGGAHVALESEPRGPVVARLGDETDLGSPASLSVVATKPGWLGVSAPEMPNGELGWIARDPRRVEVRWTRWSLRADLSARSLELRYAGEAVRRFAVTVGGPGTETPPGRYGVTDGVSFEESPYYGCCALALSGHQTAALPAGWIGGDRLAIHGTPGAVGTAESLGCIRATDDTMRYLFRRIPLGTPVFISA